MTNQPKRLPAPDDNVFVRVLRAAAKPSRKGPNWQNQQVTRSDPNADDRFRYTPPDPFGGIDTGRPVCFNNRDEANGGAEMLTAANKQSITASLAKTRSIADPTVTPKALAEAYVAALPSSVSDALVAEAFEFAKSAVLAIRQSPLEESCVIVPVGGHSNRDWCRTHSTYFEFGKHAL